jgi:ERCC4-type nuclease
MKIKIDNRERELIKHIQQLIEKSYPSLTISIETLPLGDIILTDNDDNEKIIMERKSILDLASSIRDGRYDEQSYRLDGIHFHNHNICYLVEGEMNSFTMNRFKTKVDKPTIFSAILSLNYYKGFSVIRTFSIEETAFFICNSAYKLEI